MSEELASSNPLAPTASEHRTLLQRFVAFNQRAFIEVGVLPLLLIGLVLFFGLTEPRFLSTDNMFNLSRQASFLVIVALAQAVVIISGGFDLSVGGLVALTSVITARVMSGMAGDGSVTAAIVVACLAGVAVGLVIGAVNGFCVALLRVPPFVVTLGMSSVAVGLALMFADGAPVRGLPREFSDVFGVGKWLGLATPVWFAIGLTVVMILLMSRTRFGRHVYAVGGNERAARLSGVSVWSTKWRVYVLASTVVAVAGVLLTARVSSGEPNLGGPFPLESIAAAVLGGVALGGGEGRVAGAAGGAIFVVMLQNGMNLIRVANYVQMIVIGVALVIAYVIDQLRTRVKTAQS